VSPSCYIERDEYASGSHLSDKYELEKTVEYPDYTEDEELMVERLLAAPQATADLTTLEIERLIDLAYSKYSGK